MTTTLHTQRISARFKDGAQQNQTETGQINEKSIKSIKSIYSSGGPDFKSKLSGWGISQPYSLDMR